MRAFLLASGNDARGPQTAVGAVHPRGACTPKSLLRATRLSRAFAATHHHALTTLFALLVLLSVRNADAQYPGELAGRVVDAITGDPIEHVRVEVIETGHATSSDGRGEFYLRGLEPGRHRVRLSRLGYLAAVRPVEVRNGATTRLEVRLGADPFVLEELRSQAARETEADPGVFRLSRAEIQASGARTAAELLEGHAGLVIDQRGPGGTARVSIRGSAADQVLVLLDGAPLNDPLTGAVDLASLPVSQIESITVLKGSRSARFGPGAEAGAILIQSRTIARPWAMSLGAGSLGDWSVSAETGGGVSALTWSAGGNARGLNGEFDFERPSAMGGGTDRRANSDLLDVGAFAGVSGPLANGGLRVRAGFNRVERGIPGPVYLATPAAREELSRWRAQAAWERRARRLGISAHTFAVWQEARFADPQPPAGPAFDSRYEARVVGGRLDAEINLDGALKSLTAGTELRHQAYAGSDLDETAPGGRTDLGLFVGAALGPRTNSLPLQLDAALRLDRDGLNHLWRLSHEATVTLDAGALGFHIRHASSYSPPTFGDQFFKEGVLVRANPDLQAERVPSDLSAGASVEGRLGSQARGRLSVDAYTADVKDMIIWAPDFRFVWSPRNFDVNRRGLDAEAELLLLKPRLALRLSYGLARATYDRPGDDAVQVMYRPRHSGDITASWQPAAWELGLAARYIGTRYPVPAPLNALDPYWTVDLRLGRSFEAAGWRLTPRLFIERLFDNDDSLIFAYPEPGRTLRFELAAAPG